MVQCKETRRNNSLILKRSTKSIRLRSQSNKCRTNKTFTSRWNCTLLEIILYIQHLRGQRIMQCYPQPFQVEKNLNQNSMPKKKKKNQSFTIEKWRHFVTGKNLESLQHTRSLWKKEITQENSNKMKKKKRNQEGGWPGMYIQVWPRRREESLKALKKESIKMRCWENLSTTEFKWHWVTIPSQS